MKPGKNIFLFIPVFFLFTCKKENMFDCLKPTGKIVREERSIVHARYFNIGKGKINCYFTQDSIYKIEVEAGKNLIGLIKTEVKGDTLFITNHNKCNFMRSYKPQINIYISTPDLKKIIQNGVGTIKSTNTIARDSIYLETWGSPDIYFNVNCDFLQTHVHNSTAVYTSGFAKNHFAYMWHNSTFFGDNLNTNYTYIFDNTTGNFHCNASNEIDAAIQLSGDIYYSGNPLINVDNIGGTGKLIKQ